MASPSEKLADSLDVLRKLQETGRMAIRSREISRTHRERLIQHGFLREVIKGWYVVARPAEPEGESTAWYAAFWPFAAQYLEARFGPQWSLSPEQSLSLHSGNRRVPQQLIARAPRAGNTVTPLPCGTTLLDVRAALPAPADRTLMEGMRVFSIDSALVECSPSSFSAQEIDVRAVLSTISDPSPLLRRLLEQGRSTVAGRLAGAFRNVGREEIATEIVKTMSAAGYDVRESDPFDSHPATPVHLREKSPYANRIRLLWEKMRAPAIEQFPRAPKARKSVQACLRAVEDAYVADAYHSLSIEGYQVSAELIDRVRTGTWNPDSHYQDRQQRNAMAARGYFQAFRAVEESIKKTLNGQQPGQVARTDHRDWYRELFAPCVTAGLLRPADLAGHRNGPIYIRGSRHVPPSHAAVPDAMHALFELLSGESDPAVRVVLGHFVFVYIHPYVDGNGRMGRFLMNLMAAAGGYPWTVIPVSERDTYMAALEQASVGEDIMPFAKFLGNLVKKRLAGGPLPEVPQA